MKVAIVGSRNLHVEDIGKYIPEGVTEIISGGAFGIDSCARLYARQHGLKMTEFFPNYRSYGRSAPLVRNKLIVEASDYVLALWDSKSRGTKFSIDYAKQIGKPVEVVIL